MDYKPNDDSMVTDNMHEAPMPHDDGGAVATLPKTILGGKAFKVGDEVVLKITNIGGDTVSVEYAPEEGPMSMDDMNKMSEDDARAMPMAEMEKRLPKAE